MANHLETKPTIEQLALAARIKALAADAGFDRVGIAPVDASAYRTYLRKWLDDGQAGEMHWLVGRFDERTDVAAYFPGARSVICVAMNYHVPLEKVPADQSRFHGKIARYALGGDYHALITDRLHRLADEIRQLAPDAQTRCAVDTAPVMEKELAARAGVGWMGKNTCIIDESIGSWLLLGEIITTLDLPAEDPAVDRCGTCTRCIEACPTSAITAPYQLDARKCISYLTIEHRSAIAPELQSQIGEWLFGCDICQDVCPWNSKAPTAADPALQPRFATGTLDVRDVLTWDNDQYNAALKKSAMKRVKLPVLQRNARIAQMNLEKSK